MVGKEKVAYNIHRLGNLDVRFENDIVMSNYHGNDFSIFLLF